MINQKVKEHPIIFNGEMVRAILDGRKTQTRRVIKAGPKHKIESVIKFDSKWGYGIFGCDCDECREANDHMFGLDCPYGSSGDELWVREAFLNESGDEFSETHYPATMSAPQLFTARHIRKRPSIHMPRWASRIQLKIKDVRVEMVQDICPENIYFEGIQTVRRDQCMGKSWRKSQIKAWIELWDSINEKRGHSWESNPWVWVVEFELKK